MLRLKLQYFGHVMQRTDSLEKPLMLGKTDMTGTLGTWTHGRMTAPLSLMENLTKKMLGIIGNCQGCCVADDLVIHLKYFSPNKALKFGKA